MAAVLVDVTKEAKATASGAPVVALARDSRQTSGILHQLGGVAIKARVGKQTSTMMQTGIGTPS